MYPVMFRVWDTYENKWEIPEIFLLTGDGRLLKRGKYDELEYVVARYRVFFSTKLKDKNGKEIYEGDILNGRYGRDIVRFVDGGFRPLCGSINCPKAPDEVEVIGNVQQNPELLKEK